jgi:Na+/proline symporter
MYVMLGMIAVFYAFIIYILYRTKNTDDPTFNEYSVGGRRYGPCFVAMAYVNSWWPGTVFIAFFGLAAGSGVFGFYGLAYSTVGLGTMYYLASRSWRWGAYYNIRSQPELLGLRYNSNAVKVVASVIGVISILPWIVLGIQSFGEVFVHASQNSWSITTSLIVGIVLILIRQYWTVQMGMRGLIMTDFVQGSLAYVVAGLVCLYFLLGLGGPPISFAELRNVPASFLRVPGDGGTYGDLYLFSLIFTGVIGSLCWPMSFQRIYTASGVRAVKGSTVCAILISGGFYSLMTLFALAAFSIPGVMEHPQQAWFISLESYGGTWLLGLGITMVFAASMGHVDGSVQVSGLQIANDLANTERRNLSDRQLTYIAKISMVVIMLIAGVLAFLTFNMTRLQLLAQLSYQSVIQLSVPLFFGIFWRGGNKYAALTGMLSGFVTAAALTVLYPDDIPPLGSLTSGVVGLIVNLTSFLALSYALKLSVREKARVAEMFEIAEEPVNRSASDREVSVGEATATELKTGR